jgi:hypothetical protein
MARPKKRKDRAERLHREPIVRRVAELLLSGEPTHWRWTTACRHGIRAALCEQGYRNGNPTISPWEQADRHAEAIVTAARHRIGLSRLPTWSEAQGDPPQERVYYFCSSCGGYIEGGASRPWCGDECKASTFSSRYSLGGYYDERARIIARDAVLGKLEKLPARPRERKCKGCGTPFILKEPRQQFCSRDCGRRAVRMTRVQEARPCLICATSFTPSAESGLYCSPPCVAEAVNRAHRARRARLRVWHEKKCKICEQPFKVVGKSIQAYCGTECAEEAHRRSHRDRMQVKAQAKRANAMAKAA